MPCKTDADMDGLLWASAQLHDRWEAALASPALLDSMVAHLSARVEHALRLTFIRGGSSPRCKPLQCVLPQRTIGLADLAVVVRQVDRRLGLVDWRIMLLKAHIDGETTSNAVDQDTVFYRQWPAFTFNTGMLGVRKQGDVYRLPCNGWAAERSGLSRNFFFGFMKFKAVQDFRSNISRNDLLTVVDPMDQSLSNYSFLGLFKQMTQPWSTASMNVGLNLLDLKVAEEWSGMLKNLWAIAGTQRYQNHNIRIAKPTLMWIDHLFEYRSRRIYQDVHFVSEQGADFDGYLFPPNLMSKVDLTWDPDQFYKPPNKAAKTGLNWLVLDVHSI